MKEKMQFIFSFVLELLYSVKSQSAFSRSVL